ncbi:hypothetical protein BJ684DRAFT_22227 [Piptocephalis cylindrospora]|uniref:AP complex mu/sigma subunit domain-containing protein n=1 Tax=Piptocephalis cylindrospora TaxID=1907219 RepID=A0A4P9XY14_9FUNG|nr:hypothetical protein BJ684DRAFT_22227 [Piptocephalis cylindrospora]|eukprot:RKP11224.1 hypothetical protein BJ684DRAFT_22227 [Piptocephalis cylindrospora]
MLRSFHVLIGSSKRPLLEKYWVEREDHQEEEEEGGGDKRDLGGILPGLTPVDSFLELYEAASNNTGPGSSQTRPDTILNSGRQTFVHFSREGLLYVAEVRKEASPLVVFELLYSVYHVFVEYFEEVTEVALKDNFVTAYMVR